MSISDKVPIHIEPSASKVEAEWNRQPYAWARIVTWLIRTTHGRWVGSDTYHEVGLVLVNRPARQDPPVPPPWDGKVTLSGLDKCHL